MNTAARGDVVALGSIAGIVDTIDPDTFTLGEWRRLGRPNGYRGTHRRPIVAPLPVWQRERRFETRVAALADYARELCFAPGDAYAATRTLAAASGYGADRAMLVLECVRQRLLGVLDIEPSDRITLTAIGLVSVATIDAATHSTSPSDD